MLDRRSFLGGCTLGGLVGPVAARAAEPAPEASSGDWLFIQVTCEKGLPALADEGEAAGRIEVSIAGQFVGCAQASFHLYRGQMVLVPMQLGFAARGRPQDVKVELFGELARYCRHHVQITEHKR